MSAQRVSGYCARTCALLVSVALAAVQLGFVADGSGAATRKVVRADAKVCARYKAVYDVATSEQMRWSNAELMWEERVERKFPDSLTPTERTEQARVMRQFKDANTLQDALYSMMLSIGCDPYSGKPTQTVVAPSAPRESPGESVRYVPDESAPFCAALLATRDYLLREQQFAKDSRNAKLTAATDKFLSDVLDLVAARAAYEIVGIDEATGEVVTPTSVATLKALIKVTAADWRTLLKSTKAASLEELTRINEKLANVNTQLVVYKCDESVAPVPASPSSPPASTSTTTKKVTAPTTTKKPTTSTGTVLNAYLGFDIDWSVHLSGADYLNLGWYCVPRITMASDGTLRSGTCGTADGVVKGTVTGHVDVDGRSVQFQLVVDYNGGSAAGHFVATGTARSPTPMAANRIRFTGDASYTYTCSGGGSHCSDYQLVPQASASYSGTIPFTLSIEP